MCARSSHFSCKCFGNYQEVVKQIKFITLGRNQTGSFIKWNRLSIKSHWNAKYVQDKLQEFPEQSITFNYFFPLISIAKFSYASAFHF